MSVGYFQTSHEKKANGIPRKPRDVKFMCVCVFLEDISATRRAKAKNASGITRRLIYLLIIKSIVFKK